MKGKFRGTFETSGGGFDVASIVKLAAILVAAFAVVAFVVTFVYYIAVFVFGMVIGGSIVAFKLRVRRNQGNGRQADSGYRGVATSDNYIRVSDVVQILHGTTDERGAIQERRNGILGRAKGRAGAYDMVEKEVED